MVNVTFCLKVSNRDQGSKRTTFEEPLIDGSLALQTPQQPLSATLHFLFMAADGL